MIKLLLVTPDRDSLSDFSLALEKYDDVDLSWAKIGSQALDIIKDNDIALVVADERPGDMTGFEFAERLVSVNPMTNCALISPMLPEAFHEASEGLGLLEPLPPHPGEQQAKDLLQYLKNILKLL